MSIDETQRRLLPNPGWREATEPFWFAAGKGQLTIPKCAGCGNHRWPLEAGCYKCNAIEFTWDKVVGTGRVFSFTWADFPPPPDGERNIAVIELDGVQGESVRVMSWVTDIARRDLVCGLPVEAVFLPLDEEVAVPAWRPRR